MYNTENGARRCKQKKEIWNLEEMFLSISKMRINEKELLEADKGNREWTNI